ncbi:MAG TPA: glutamate synthase subunit alpha, partial [Streptosporangiaceae bacterium]|nr:glutamate synthase subunit alpha [Streptosporangiaceae bacterium]
MASAHLQPPAGQPGPGLYDSSYEHDACGVGFIADLTGRCRHETVADALTVLRNLEHRGAQGADPETGDGAGILTQMPDEFLRAVTGFPLPPAGSYAAGLAFLPAEASLEVVAAQVEQIAAAEGLAILGWREVPHDPERCGAGSRAVLPQLVQLFVAGLAGESGIDLDRRAYCLRKRAEHDTAAYLASLSSATIVYKGMLTAQQLEPFFPDLADERYRSAIALVHSRFSTNTFPSWPLAHPYRLIAHNGEINT